MQKFTTSAVHTVASAAAPVMKYIDVVCEMQEKKQLENRN